MHTYASDSLDRRIAPWVIAVFAVGIAFLYEVISRKYQFSLPWWCEAPSILMVYGFLQWLYDSWLWKQEILRVKLCQIPNCNGTWCGELHSSHDKGIKKDGILIVHQTWTKIFLEFKTDSSSSSSRMASLNVTPGISQGLIYEYTNDPRAITKDTMHAHRGLAFLKFSADVNWLEGEYYTGRDRTNYGTMRLRFVSRKLLDLQEAKNLYSHLEKGSI